MAARGIPRFLVSEPIKLLYAQKHMVTWCLISKQSAPFFTGLQTNFLAKHS